MFPEYKDRLNTHGCSSAIQVIEDLEKQVEKLKKELSLAIEIIEDSGIDYDEVVEAKGESDE